MKFSLPSKSSCMEEAMDGSPNSLLHEIPARICKDIKTPPLPFPLAGGKLFLHGKKTYILIDEFTQPSI